MATIYKIHPETPQTRSIEQIKQVLRSGAVMLYPTDTVYAIGCDLNSKSAVERVRKIKRMSNDKPLTFLCPSLSNIAQYAAVTDSSYRIMRRLIPGPYTFILPATKLVPRLVMNPKRKTTGIRVPDSAICQSILLAMDNPIISTSAHIFEDEEGASAYPVEGNGHSSRVELFERLDKLVDVIIDDGLEPQYQASTILDLTEDEPILVRRGLGADLVDSWMGELMAH